MDRDEKARKAQLRVIDVFTRKPEAALSTVTGLAEIREGLACTFTQGGHSAVLDMVEAVGGDDAGPTPGFYGRAAIAGCVAVGIKMAATREGLKFDSVNVGIEQDWDDRGVFALPGAPVVSSETRLSIKIETAEPSEMVDDLVDRVLAHDPWFLSFRDAQAVTTDISVSQGN